MISPSASSIAIGRCERLLLALVVRIGVGRLRCGRGTARLATLSATGATAAAVGALACGRRGQALAFAAFLPMVRVWVGWRVEVVVSWHETGDTTKRVVVSPKSY